MAAPVIFTWRLAQRSGDGSHPGVSRGKTPVVGLAGTKPLEAEAVFADIVCRFLLQKRSKFENFANSFPDSSDSWPVCFTVRAKRHFWEVSPDPQSRKLCNRSVRQLVCPSMNKIMQNGCHETWDYGLLLREPMILLKMVKWQPFWVYWMRHRAVSGLEKA